MNAAGSEDRNGPVTESSSYPPAASADPSTEADVSLAVVTAASGAPAAGFSGPRPPAGTPRPQPTTTSATATSVPASDRTRLIPAASRRRARPWGGAGGGTPP